MTADGSGAGVPALEAFVRLLDARDFDGIEALFAPEICFRALTPQGLREASCAKEATGWFRTWFEGADRLAVENPRVEPVGERARMEYRVRLLRRGVWSMVNEQAYCDVDPAGRVTSMDLLCSGLWPLEPPASVPSDAAGP
ncbi:MAG: nuclear transport factor 2 family protein [Dehalococcoidia bacterium]